MMGMIKYQAQKRWLANNSYQADEGKAGLE